MSQSQEDNLDCSPIQDFEPFKHSADKELGKELLQIYPRGGYYNLL
jgi:hypothetical protein